MQKLCECGCGNYANDGKRFIHNHHMRGENNPNYRRGDEMSGKIILIMVENFPLKLGKKCPMAKRGNELAKILIGMEKVFQKKQKEKYLKK